MDWLVKYVTLRNVVVLLVGAFLIRLAVYNRHRPIYWLERRFNPPAGPTPASGQDIMADLERQETAHVQARYRQLMAELEEARSRGIDVDGLERKAQAAASLDAQFRRDALRILNEIELQIPKQPDAPPAKRAGS